jgi:hypothetical protein
MLRTISATFSCPAILPLLSQSGIPVILPCPVPRYQDSLVSMAEELLLPPEHRDCLVAFQIEVPPYLQVQEAFQGIP